MPTTEAGIELAAFCLLFATIIGLIAYANTMDRRRPEREPNEFAHLLGTTVEAKVYEGSEWERMVVVAVSWKGAVCVRPERDMLTKGRWIDRDKARHRVREITERERGKRCPRRG